LVTGGAGFIGRWVVKRLLEDGHKVWFWTTFPTVSAKNIEEFLSNPNFAGFVEGDIKNIPVLETLFENKFDICYHLAASINVQDSMTTGYNISK